MKNLKLWPHDCSGIAVFDLIWKFTSEIAPKVLHLVNFNQRYVTFTMVEGKFWKYTLDIAPEWLYFLTFGIYNMV